eukprot:4014228-Prymnesium_polylepis.1
MHLPATMADASLPPIHGTSFVLDLAVQGGCTPDSRHGRVLGFLEHDVWKTGIEYGVTKLSAVKGVNGVLLTRWMWRHTAW